MKCLLLSPVGKDAWSSTGMSTRNTLKTAAVFGTKHVFKEPDSFVKDLNVSGIHFLLADVVPLPAPIVNELGFCYCNSASHQHTVHGLMSKKLISFHGSLPDQLLKF